MSTRAPAFIVYGPPGTGKSTETAVAFQDCLYVISQPGNLWAYESLVAAQPQLGLKKTSYMPSMLRLPYETKEWDPETELRVLVLPQAVLGDDLQLRPVHTITAMNDLIYAFTKQVMQGTNKSKGIIFDEFSELSARMLKDLEDVGWDPAVPKPYGSSWDKWGPLYRWHSDLVVRQKALNVPMGFICHDTEPEIKGDDVVAKGGPNLPSKKLRKLFCAYVDVVLHRLVEKPESAKKGAKNALGLDDKEEEAIDMAPEKMNPYGVPSDVVRYYMTEVDPMWERKIRAFGLNPKDTRDLLSVLRQARFA